MKWQEYKEKVTTDVYNKARNLCEEIHALNLKKKGIAARGCRFCYKKEGKICFPCTEIKELMEERYQLKL